MTGKVKWFDTKKGYGFIVSDGKDVFVRYSAIIDNEEYKDLVKGELVTFELIKTDQGYKAKYVRSKGANE